MWIWIVWVIGTLIAFGLMYGYVGRRLTRPAPWSRKKKRLLWVALVLFMLLPNLAFFLEMRYPHSPVLDGLSWINYLALGFLTLLFALMLIRDLAWWLGLGLGGIIRWNGRRNGHATTRPDLERRRFILHTANLGLVGLNGALTGYGLFESRRPPELVEIPLTLPGLAPEFNGLRIAQISDLHVGPTIKRPWVRMVVDRVNRAAPDLIVFTGDLVDGRVKDLRRDTEPMADLSAPLGAFFITGNHEYYSGAREWVEEAARLGFTVLLNEHRVLTKGPGRLVLGGVTDIHAGRFIPEHESIPAKALAGAPGNTAKILLAHQPKSVFAAVEAGADLVLCGHTHGGQYFPWHFVVSLDQPFLSGLHRVGGAWCYVNRGTGYWGPPLRLGAPSEITVFTLTATGRKVRLPSPAFGRAG